jgi:hypothetical protein
MPRAPAEWKIATANRTLPLFYDVIASAAKKETRKSFPVTPLTRLLPEKRALSSPKGWQNVIFGEHPVIEYPLVATITHSLRAKCSSNCKLRFSALT